MLPKEAAEPFEKQLIAPGLIFLGAWAMGYSGRDGRLTTVFLFPVKFGVTFSG